MDIKKKLTLSTCAFALLPGREDEIAKHFEFAAAAGFEAFEIAYMTAGNPSDLCRAVRNSGAPICAVHGILNPNACAKDRKLRDMALDIAVRYLETFAEFAPCPVVEHYWDRYLDPEHGRYFHDTVGKLLEKCEELGFLFCMENAPYKPETSERYPTVKEVADFAASFGKDRMFMTFDVNHANLNEDVLQAVRDCNGLIRHIHISDNHGHREEHLLPGEGIIDLRAVVREIYDNNYTGPCNFEFCFPKGFIAGKDDCKKVAAYIKEKIL